MYNISNEDRQELLKYLSTQPYANVFKLVCDYAGKNPVYVREKMMPKINKRKQLMEEGRIY